MKIAVVSYDELNTKPDEEEVISDLKKYYLGLKAGERQELGSELIQLFETQICGNSGKIEFAFLGTSEVAGRQYIPGKIKELHSDLIVSYNLAGFEWTTLTDALGYNLICTPQIHFVKKHGLPGEQYLTKVRAINLFMAWEV